MRSAPVKTALSFDEFLEFEVSSFDRHEFVDGNLFVMAGGTLRHNFLKDELHSLWRVAARAVGCRSFTGDVITRLPNDTGYFPDVFVTCESVNGSSRVMTKPCIIVEVLSASTEIFDRGEKWQNYQTIPSLEQYVLLSQSEPFAEVYSRQSDGAWRYQSFSGAAIISFSSIAFDLSLEALYLDLPVG
jgi:Uma2 family endonuclease